MAKMIQIIFGQQKRSKILRILPEAVNHLHPLLENILVFSKLIPNITKIKVIHLQTLFRSWALPPSSLPLRPNNWSPQLPNSTPLSRFSITEGVVFPERGLGLQLWKK